MFICPSFFASVLRSHDVEKDAIQTKFWASQRRIVYKPVHQHIFACVFGIVKSYTFPVVLLLTAIQQGELLIQCNRSLLRKSAVL